MCCYKLPDYLVQFACAQARLADAHRTHKFDHRPE